MNLQGRIGPAITTNSHYVSRLSLDTSPLTLALTAPEHEWGTPEIPSNSVAVAGSYYCGDGLGYNISLALETNGNYSAEWDGCLDKYPAKESALIPVIMKKSKSNHPTGQVGSAPQFATGRH
jgi:hypothetical protein